LIASQHSVDPIHRWPVKGRELCVIGSLDQETIWTPLA
jgi:hypothetical protein